MTLSTGVVGITYISYIVIAAVMMIMSFGTMY